MSEIEGQKYKRLGVLDIGSNSVRFVIFELFGASFTPIYSEKVLAGLGRDLSVTGALSQIGKDEALRAIIRFKTIADAQNLDPVLIVATAALREANDAAGFIHIVQEQTGWDISPISGQEEARLTALGVIAMEPRAHGIAADLGGASLELIQMNSGKAGIGRSYPIGPFAIMGRNLSGKETWNVEAIKASINASMDDLGVPFDQGQILFLIGGAWRNLAAVHQARHLYPLKTVQGYSLMPGAAQDLARWAYGSGREDILQWSGLSKKRAETLPYSGLLLEALLERFNPEKIIISQTGIREGLVYDSLPDNLQSRDALLDGCRDLARGSLQGLHFAAPLYAFLKPLMQVCPGAFEAENETRLRQAACHLVGIGKGLHPDYRAALVFDDVLYAPLAGLTHKERAYLALILYHSYTGSQSTPNNSAIKLLLSLSERAVARTYGTAIRLGVIASGRSPDLLQEFELIIEEARLVLKVSPAYKSLVTERVTYRLEKLAACLNMNSDTQ